MKVRSHPTKSGASRLRPVVLWLVQLGLYWLVWLGLAGSADKPETLTGLAAAALAATGSHIAWGQHLVHFTAHPRWLAQAIRLPVAVIRGTGVIFAALAREAFLGPRVPSLFRAAPYTALGNDPASAAERALAIAYTSISPDNIVVGIDRRQGYLLYHLLVDDDVPDLARHLGAEA